MNLQITKLFLLLAFILLNLMGKCVGQKDYQLAGLKKHNEYRRRHQVDPMELDTELNTMADKCAEYYSGIGTINHMCPERVAAGVGENLYMFGATSKDPIKTVEKSVDGWYNEVDLYDFDKGESKNGDWQVTGHFTQVVWKGSKKLGIGFANKDKAYVVGLYKPPGNYQKENKNNVFPADVSRESVEIETKDSVDIKPTKSTESTDTAPAFTSSAYLVGSLIILGGVAAGFLKV